MWLVHKNCAGGDDGNAKQNIKIIRTRSKVVGEKVSSLKPRREIEILMPPTSACARSRGYASVAATLQLQPGWAA